MLSDVIHLSISCLFVISLMPLQFHDATFMLCFILRVCVGGLILPDVQLSNLSAVLSNVVFVVSSAFLLSFCVLWFMSWAGCYCLLLLPNDTVHCFCLLLLPIAIAIAYCYYLLLLPIVITYCYCRLLLPIAITYCYCLLLLPIAITYCYYLLLLPIAITYCYCCVSVQELSKLKN